jgi:hypothetical protein
MTVSPEGEEERQLNDWRKILIREVDAALKSGVAPDLGVFVARWPEEEDEVKSIIALRTSLFEEGILDAPEEDPTAESDPLMDGDSKERDDALADIKREFQDAMNRGDHPDVVGIVDERPELKDEVVELSQYYNFIADALKPDFVGPAPEPVQEVVLSHFRLVTMHGRHPLGGLFLGVDTQSGKHAELLVIRGQMSRARGGRLLREALAPKDLRDPGIVPVIDAGEVHDLRFVAWEYKAELTCARIIKRLRRGAGMRTLPEILLQHDQETPDQPRVVQERDEDSFPGIPEDAASRLLANPSHVASVLELVATAAESLDRAHLRGILLADIRPENVFVAANGQARLRGFGLVQHARAAWHRLGDDLTFLAPEVLRDDEPPLDWRADVYGVGLLLYALLALRDPPDFGTIQHRNERLFLDLRGAPQDLLPLLDRALDRDPSVRPVSCGVMATELRKMAAALRPPPPPTVVPEPPVPAWVWYGFLTLILVAVVTSLLWWVL